MNLWHVFLAALIGGITSQLISFILGRFNARHTAFNEDLNAYREECFDLIEQLKVAACEVWGNNGGDCQAETEKVQTIVLQLSELKAHFENEIGLAPEISNKLLKLHRVCTDGEFDVIGRKPMPTKKMLIQIDALRLRLAIRSTLRKRRGLF